MVALLQWLCNTVHSKAGCSKAIKAPNTNNNNNKECCLHVCMYSTVSPTGLNYYYFP